MARALQLAAVDASLVTIDFQVGFAGLAQRPQGVGQGVVQLLFRGCLAPRVKAGLADKRRGDDLYQALLQLQHAAAGQGHRALQFNLAAAF